VLDSGVDPRHPDLAAKLLPGASFLHVDPAPIPAGSTCPPNAGVDDDFGHGTHVAGIAAAATDNGLGVAGIGWQTRLLPVKVLDCTGNGSDAQVIAGIDWAVGQRAWVINLSFGGPGQSDVLDAAIDRARRAGVLVVAAAGNGATDVPFYPAASPGALAVTATDQQDRFAASFSNRGSYVGLAAPGVDIVSTYPTYMEPVGYRVMSGTSMAAPHVSGVAALLLSRHPEYGPSRTMGVLFASAEKVESCPPGVAACPYDRLGRNDYYGYGRVNAARALRFTSAGLLPLILNRASP
jgi:subtilisin family serine protease